MPLTVAEHHVHSNDAVAEHGVHVHVRGVAVGHGVHAEDEEDVRVVVEVHGDVLAVVADGGNTHV